MLFRPILSFVLSYCLVMHPTHARAVATHEILKDFIKTSGMNQQTTVATWIKKNQAYFHPKVAEMATQWAAKNPNVKLPAIHTTSFKGQNGQEVTRLVFSDKKQNFNVDIVTQGDKVYAVVDGKKYSYNDIYYDGILDQAVSSSQLTWNELGRIHKVNKTKAAVYQASVRNMVNSLTAFEEQWNARARKTSFIDMILEQAYAVADGSRCIVGGYVSAVSSGSCGHGDPKITQGCASGNVKCNPLVYGYEKGKEKCVPRAPATEVSPLCDALYPIPGKEKDLVDSVIASINAKKPEERSQAWEQFFTNLETDIKNASDVCLGSGFDFEGYKKIVKENGQTKPFQASQFVTKFPVDKNSQGKDVNEHHRIACETVMNRLFYMDCGKECARQTIAAADANDSTRRPESIECKYAAGAMTFPVQDNPAAIVEPLPEDIKTLPAVVVTAEREKKKAPAWLWFVLAGAAVCIFWLCKDKDKKPKTPPWTPPVLPPMPVGKPGESETPRTPGAGGVGATPPTVTIPAVPVDDSGAVKPRGGVN